MSWLVPWLVLTPALSAGMELDAEPPLLPSGMDLLYSDQVAFAPSGEPIVTIGLMDGQRRIEVEGEVDLQVDFYEAGVLKRSTVPAGRRIAVRLTRATPAERQHYLDLDGVAWGNRDKLEWALAGWRARGYPSVTALEEGTVLGIAGRVLDNRIVRIILPAASAADAQRLADELYERYGERAAPRTRLVERPWGELEIGSPQGPLGVATSYVRFSPMDAGDGSTRIRVLAVEHGRGYRWHGFEDRTYRGEIYVVVDPDGHLAAVNVLGAEGVLKGVVPSELFATAPAGALQAQAVAARNHLLSVLGRRHHGDPFHLCSEQHCQVYTGIAREAESTNAAVDATFGQALFHGDALVRASYSSTCGGHTEDNDAVWGDSPDPALRGRPDFDVEAHPELEPFKGSIDDASVERWVRITPPTYCSQASFAQKRLDKFRWRRRFTAAEVRTAMAASHRDVGALRAVRVRERGPGGKVISLEVEGGTGSTTVLLELPIRSLFDNLNSGTFVIESERDAAGVLSAVTFVGAGWGHGVGMCQLGAIGRAEAGHDYRAILAHYYNGAELVTLYGAR